MCACECLLVESRPFGDPRAASGLPPPTYGIRPAVAARVREESELLNRQAFTPLAQPQPPRINLFNPHLGAVQIVAQEMARVQSVRSEVLALNLGFLSGMDDTANPVQAPALTSAPSAGTVAPQQPPQVEHTVHAIDGGLSGQSAHVVAKWLGHSPLVAAKHDLQTRDAYFEVAIRGGARGMLDAGVVSAMAQQTPSSIRWRSLVLAAFRIVGLRDTPQTMSLPAARSSRSNSLHARPERWLAC